MDTRRLTGCISAAMIIAAAAGACVLEELPGDEAAVELETGLSIPADEPAATGDEAIDWMSECEPGSEPGELEDCLGYDPEADSTSPSDPFREESISPEDSVEWEIRPGPGNAMSGRMYSLYNAYTNSYVRYGERDFGINLVWSNTAPNNVTFEREGGGTINYGDRVAMRIADGGYVRYQSRDWGINLVWSSSPHYEWVIQGGSGPVPLDTPVRLHNTVEQDDVIYCQRPFGINLVWADDCEEIPGVGRVRL